MEQRDSQPVSQSSSDSTVPRVINPYVEESKSKAGRFVTLSMFVHAAMVATVALMSFPPPEIQKSNLIEIEMTGDSSASVPNGSDQAAGSGASAGQEEAKVSADDIAALPEPAAPAAPAPPPPPPAPLAVAAPPPPPAPAPKAAAPKAATPKSAPKPVAKAVIQDTHTPDLETSETGEVPVSQIDDKDVQEDAERIDQSQKEAAIAAEAQAEAQAAAVIAAKEARRKEEAAAVAAQTEQRLQAAREARAQERAQAEARVREQAAIDAKAAADARANAEAERHAAAARATGSGGQGEKTAAEGAGEGKTSGDSSGDSTSPEPTKQVAGIPGGVRTLGQLRQRPGNRNPEYEPKERLARQEGKVVFYAYVNKDGSLSEFKIAESTSFRNLDDKTLNALRKWKFYPGQEGWVEMPFQWSLRGQAQEAGGLLR